MLLLGALGLALLWAAPVLAAEVLTNDAVLALKSAGLGDEVIIGKIRISEPQYDLSTDGLLRLKAAGLSEKVIEAMLAASAKPTAGAAAEVSAEDQQKAIGLYREGKLAEATALLDRLIAEKPADEVLRIWKARVMLEQARAMREAKAKDFKPIVLAAYGILQPMGRSQMANADWNYGMAKAFWLNERSGRARRVLEKVLTTQPAYHDARMLLGEMAYDEAMDPVAYGRSANRDATRLWQDASDARQAYEKALAAPGLPPAQQAEALYRIGMVWDTLERNTGEARKAWERAAAADPAGRYGVLAQERVAKGKP